MKQKVATLLAAALTLVGNASTSYAGTFTDMWWNAGESGWGMNVVQQEETAVITLFTYDANRQPVWYFASTAPVTAYTASGLPIFVAELYRTRGPWEGGTFDPTQVSSVRVGVLSLEPLDKDRLRLSYSVDGLVVNKNVTRMTFRHHYVAGTYRGVFNLRQTLPGQIPVGVLESEGEVFMHVDGGQAFMRTFINGVQCDYPGNYQQSGKLGRFAGNFTCTNGRAGSFEIKDFEITGSAISGQMATSTPNLSERGRFAAALR